MSKHLRAAPPVGRDRYTNTRPILPMETRRAMKLSALAAVAVLLLGAACASINGPYPLATSLHPKGQLALHSARNWILNDPKCNLIFTLALHENFGPYATVSGFLEAMSVTGVAILEPRDSMLHKTVVGRAWVREGRMQLNNEYLARPDINLTYIRSVIVHEYAHLAGYTDARFAEQVCFGSVISASP